MVIDFHTHCYPDFLVEHAISKLLDSFSYYGTAPETDGTYRGLKEKEKRFGVDKMVVLHIATAPRQHQNVNHFAKEINNGVDTLSFGSVHPDGEDALDWLCRIKELGLQGVKFHPDFQKFEVDDKKYFPVYERIRDLGLCCIFHAGWDPVSADYSHATPDKLKRVHDQFPGMKLILAHMGGMKHWDEVEELLVGKGIPFDTSQMPEMPKEQALRIIQKNGAENMLFASDCPWGNAKQVIGLIDSFPLSSKEKDLIYYQNAMRLLKWEEN